MIDKLRREKMIEEIEEMTGFPVFGIDVGKDEVESNPSFFICYTNGQIQKGEANFILQRDAVLIFFSEKEKINEYAIIKKSPSWGLSFDRADYDYGKFGNTQKTYEIVTFYFHRPVKLECCHENRI